MEKKDCLPLNNKCDFTNCDKCEDVKKPIITALHASEAVRAVEIIETLPTRIILEVVISLLKTIISIDSKKQ